MAADREVKVRFTGDSANIKGAAGDVSKVFRSLMDDADDARGAGEKLAAAYEQVADSMRKDMDAISEAADVVRDSLGPDMTRAIEASGRTVEDQVQAWRKLGLTLDDITRDSDELARGLRQLDDSARQSTGSVGDGMRKMSVETDNSRSVMANFTGNAIQELPGVAGAMGPLNMAIGQFAEYATEGNIKLRNLLTTGAGIAAVAVVLDQMAKAAERQAKVKAFDKAQVDGYASSLADASTRMQAIVDHLREVQKMEFSVGTFGIFDVTDAFVQLGLQVDDTARLIEGGRDGVLEWGESLKSQGANADTVNAAMYALLEQIESFETAAEAAAYTAQFLGEETVALAVETDRGADMIEKHMDATTANALAQEALATAFEEAEEAQRELTSAQLASIDSTYAVADANDRFIESMEALAVAVDDPTTGVNELDAAQRAAEQSAIASAQAIVANAETMAAAAGAPLTARESNYLLIESLYATAASLGPNSPVGLALVEHINTLQGVPGDVSTTVTADTTQAAAAIDELDRGAEKLNTETETTANAETQTALDAVETLSLAVDGVPDKITVDVSLSGYTVTMSQLSQLGTRLDEVKRKADEADRAVGRVAG